MNTAIVNASIKRSLVVLGLAAALAASVASAQSAGARGLGRWAGDGYWYPARVAAVHPNGNLQLSYDDGDVAMAAPGDFRPLNWRVGSQVQCNYANQGRYYPAVIAGMQGEMIEIAYSDGGRETALVGRCRSN